MNTKIFVGALSLCLLLLVSNQTAKAQVNKEQIESYLTELKVSLGSLKKFWVNNELRGSKGQPSKRVTKLYTLGSGYKLALTKYGIKQSYSEDGQLFSLALYPYDSISSYYITKSAIVINLKN